MLRSIKELLGYSLLTEEGEGGVVHDFYFDDQIWIIRYLVVRLGEEAAGRKVIVSPAAFRKPDEAKRQFSIKLTETELKYSPSFEFPQQAAEVELHRDYTWAPRDRLGGSLYNDRTFEITPDSVEAGFRLKEAERTLGLEMKNSNLQSARAVTGYQFQAQDGRLGSIEDFIVNDETWGIYYLVVDTGHWYPDQKVLISPFSISEISRTKARVLLNLNWEVVQNGPRYECSRGLGQEYKHKPYQHHARPKQRMQQHKLPV